MRGKHINYAAIKLSRRNKILCVIMAIALVGLMVPHGILAQVRAFAEEQAASASLTQSEEVKNPDSLLEKEDVQKEEASEDIASEEAVSESTEEQSGDVASEGKFMKALDGSSSNYVLKDNEPNEGTTLTISASTVDGVNVETPGFDLERYDWVTWDTTIGTYTNDYVDLDTTNMYLKDPAYSGMIVRDSYVYYAFYSDVEFDEDDPELVVDFAHEINAYIYPVVVPEEANGDHLVFDHWEINDVTVNPGDEIIHFKEGQDNTIVLKYKKITNSYIATFNIDNIYYDIDEIPSGWGSTDNENYTKVFEANTSYEDIVSEWSEGNDDYNFSYTTTEEGTVLTKDTTWTASKAPKDPVRVTMDIGLDSEMPSDFEAYDYNLECTWVNNGDGKYTAELVKGYYSADDIFNSWWYYSYTWKWYFPMKSGYVFTGWVNNDIDWDEPFTEDVVFTASFEQHETAKITFSKTDPSEAAILHSPDYYYIPVGATYSYNTSYFEIDFWSEDYGDRGAFVELRDDFWFFSVSCNYEEGGTVENDMNVVFDVHGPTAYFDIGEGSIASAPSGWEATPDTEDNVYFKQYSTETKCEDILGDWAEVEITPPEDMTFHSWSSESGYLSEDILQSDETWSAIYYDAEEAYSVNAAQAPGTELKFSSEVYYNYWSLIETKDELTEFTDNYINKCGLDPEELEYGEMGFYLYDANTLAYYFYNENGEMYDIYLTVDNPDNRIIQWKVNNDVLEGGATIPFTEDVKAYVISYEDIGGSLTFSGKAKDGYTLEGLYADITFTSTDGSYEAVAYSDYYGRYELTIPEGIAGELTCVYSGYSLTDYTEASYTVKGDGTDELNQSFKLYPYADLCGYVYDKAEDPIEGATVQLLEPYTNVVVATLTTNEYGYYRFENIKPWTTGDAYKAFSAYKINVSKDYYVSVSTFDPAFQPTKYASGDINYTWYDATQNVILDDATAITSFKPGSEDEHQKFVVNGFYGEAQYEDAAIDPIFDLYYGTEIGISSEPDFAIHLKNDNSIVPYDLYINAVPEIGYDAYVWYFENEWLEDYVDPNFVLGTDKPFEDGDILGFVVEYKELAVLNVGSDDAEGHGYFHVDYYVNDPSHTTPTSSIDKDTLVDEIYAGCELQALEDGTLHIDYIDPVSEFANIDDYTECALITAVPAPGFQFSRWTAIVNDKPVDLTAGYTVGAFDRISLKASYSLIPVSEEISASAQTGDNGLYVLSIFAIVALAGVGFLSSRRQRNFR